MAESWVGGDIVGLHTMAATTAAAPAAMRDVVHALSAKVDDLVGAAGWSGGAAEAFQKRWTADSISAGSLADVVGHVGGVLGDLATNLNKVNMTLYNAEYEATKAGAPIGPDGAPGTIVSSAGTPSGPAVTALQTYCDEYDSAMQLAKGFRLDAASKLSDIYDQISYEPGHQNNPDQWATLGDYVRGLYAVPDEKGRITRGRLANMDERIKSARHDLRAAKQEYAAKGLKLPEGNAAKTAHKGVFAEFKQLKADLESAESLERKLPLSAELNTKLSDIGKAIPEIGKITSKLPEFLKEVPVVDVLATGVAVGFQVKDDMEKGWSAQHAVAADVTAGAAGLGAGAITFAVASGPVGLAAVGAGAVAVGVGAFVYQGFHEHWSEDIHNDGVVGGILTGGKHMVGHTGKEFADIGKGIGGAAAGAWHSVFG
ncbi:MAG: hypothetical protein DLM62_17690 [Pseudonocardiales bacterium]|nr:MAG: hypothetical protein DLM62_17690 [Pseudonocardiales bacterium]